jgi:hypothetical protein
MSISSRQIGWGTEENLLWQISKQLERLTQVTVISSGAISLSAIGSTPNANGGTITANVLNLQPASASFGGVITTGTQAFEGAKTFNKDLIVNTLTVGLGGGNNQYTTALGYNVLNANTTGIQNTGVGYNALTANTIGVNNVGIGGWSLSLNTTGDFNIGIGSYSLAFNTSGAENIAIGHESIVNNTTGNSNAAFGYFALYNNTTGFYNIGIGKQAGASGANANTTGSNNIFIGYQSVGVSATESNRTWIGNASTTSTWLAGNVLIGTTTDVASSKLTISSTTQGFLPPRMTNAERIAITSPAIGLIVYCTDIVEGVYVNKSTGWVFIG